MKKNIIITNKTAISKINKKKQHRNIIDCWDLPFDKTKIQDIIPVDKQYILIDEIMKNDILNNDVIILDEYTFDKSKLNTIIMSELKMKKQSYKQQDKSKNIYDDDKIISMKQIINLLVYSKLNCSYCKDEIYILYNEYRFSKQWTLDRINNDIGHHYDNCVVSCLACNLQKRRLNDDDFRFTKQMKIIKS